MVRPTAPSLVRMQLSPMRHERKLKSPGMGSDCEYGHRPGGHIGLTLSHSDSPAGVLSETLSSEVVVVVSAHRGPARGAARACGRGFSVAHGRAFVHRIDEPGTRHRELRAR